MCGLAVGLSFFFFQAEDGIRDLVRSRGLGDVYKRQAIYSVRVKSKRHSSFHIYLMEFQMQLIDTLCISAVSYTHLTLPTSDLV